MNMLPIHVYTPNLNKRSDRKESITAQFNGHEEFELHIVPAIEHRCGAWGLWQTFQKIVSIEAQKGSPFFIFCEDDHLFTANYNPELLLTNIHKADSLDADLLSGGMSWIGNPIQVDENLFWVKAFNGMQFTVVFNRFYATILACKTDEGYVTDCFLSNLSNKIFVIYPYISTQTDFGYSDVTSMNNQEGRVPALFDKSLTLLQHLDKVREFYHQPAFHDICPLVSFHDIVLPTYIINLPNRKERKESIEQQFAGRKEFDVHFIEACVHPHSNVGLWQSICKIVRMAEQGEDEVILICEDDHIFTPRYNSNTFLNQVWLAGMMGTDILSGGIGGFGNLVPVRDGLYWTDWFWCTQFIVIYRRAFSRILNADFKETDVADEYISHLLTNKLVIFPFISIQKDFGYSDVTSSNNKKGNITRHFEKSREKASIYSRIATQYGLITTVQPTQGEKIVSIMADMPIKALNLGCGTNILKGWLNTDVQPRGAAMYLDACEPFPFDDNSLDYIFSEHMFEHLSYEGGRAMLKECHRTLKPGGVLRLTMPTLDFLIKLYNEPDKDIHQQYARWSLQQYAPQMFADFAPKNMAMPIAFVVNNFMHFWGHQMIYDFSLLKSMLEQEGFRSIMECPVGESDHTYLQGIETHGNVIPKWANDLESMAVEASK